MRTKRIRTYPDRYCISCGEMKKLAAKSLCRLCYSRSQERGECPKCNKIGYIRHGICATCEGKNRAPRQCISCNEVKVIRAYNKCSDCYARERVGLCISCKQTKRLHIVDKCSVCYMRDHHYGTGASKLANSEDKCQICNVEFSSGIHMNKKCIDHCHKTSKLRGVICMGCNVGIGAFGDDGPVAIKKMKAAVAYLKNFDKLVTELNGGCKSEMIAVYYVEGSTPFSLMVLEVDNCELPQRARKNKGRGCSDAKLRSCFHRK